VGTANAERYPGQPVGDTAEVTELMSDSPAWDGIDDDDLLALVLVVMEDYPGDPPLARLRAALASGEAHAPPPSSAPAAPGGAEPGAGRPVGDLDAARPRPPGRVLPIRRFADG
jgi:hypothetical protein